MSKNILPKAARLKNDKVSKVRERKCLVTGETYPIHRLIRFVVGPEGDVIPDVAGKLPGRGGWILAEGNILQTALKKKIFIRFGHRVLAAKEAASVRKLKDVETLEGPLEETKLKIKVDDNLPDLVARLLLQRSLDYLGLVNRAGLLVSGFEKVRATLKAHKCCVLITANDAADNGRSKICSGLGIVLDKLRVIDMFSREQLGQTLGLSNAVHVALLPGGITESFFDEFSRYEKVVML
ncbi:MAG: DUF448 domain-containing protein [Emcibacter sp.]|nr:DUF448 domain-containing protein [Emcibacter sp.]